MALGAFVAQKPTKCHWCQSLLDRGDVIWTLDVLGSKTSTTLHCAECIQPEIDRQRETALLEGPERAERLTQQKRNVRNFRADIRRIAIARGVAAGRMRA
jgi:hypothetical protein